MVSIKKVSQRLLPIGFLLFFTGLLLAVILKSSDTVRFIGIGLMVVAAVFFGMAIKLNSKQK